MSGFNVYPAEVEEVIAELPGVVEVAVVGVPHPHTGEAVKAYVVLEPGVDLDEEDEVIALVRGRTLARYKCPTKVLFVDGATPGHRRQDPAPRPALSGGGGRPARGQRRPAGADSGPGRCGTGAAGRRGHQEAQRTGRRRRRPA